MFRARMHVRNVPTKAKANCSGGRSRRGTTRVTLGGVGAPRFVTDVRRTGVRTVAIMARTRRGAGRRVTRVPRRRPRMVAMARDVARGRLARRRRLSRAV